MTEPDFQILESMEADFEKLTWTFQTTASVRVSAGHYAVLHSQRFLDMNNALTNAEALLRRFLNGESDDRFKEHVMRHFDPTK